LVARVTAFQNLLTDIPGIRVGHAGDDSRIRSGVTAILFDHPVIAAASVLGGSPAIREGALLELENAVDHVHGVVLSGGSTYGLDASAGVQAALREDFAALPPVPLPRVPIVVQASLYDLVNGGDKDWGRYSPYAEFGFAAARAAHAAPFALGNVGAGIGATTATVKGGLGSASIRTPQGHIVAALVVVNAVGSVHVGDGPRFWAAPFEQAGEFGGLGTPTHYTAADLRLRTKPPTHWSGTTIGLVATDAVLTPALAKRLAILAQDGVARAVLPAHLPRDGDAMFGVSTGARALLGDTDEIAELCLAATIVTARAVARGVFEARSQSRPGEQPDWHRFFNMTRKAR
jgi:L-aminopeptidase/D-esterase-like protein